MHPLDKTTTLYVRTFDVNTYTYHIIYTCVRVLHRGNVYLYMCVSYVEGWYMYVCVLPRELYVFPY